MSSKQSFDLHPISANKTSFSVLLGCSINKTGLTQKGFWLVRKKCCLKEKLFQESKTWIHYIAFDLPQKNKK